MPRKRKPQEEEDETIYEDNLDQIRKSMPSYIALDEEKNSNSSEDEPEEILGLDLPDEDEVDEEEWDEDDEDLEVPEKWKGEVALPRHWELTFISEDKYSDLRDDKIESEENGVNDRAWGKKKHVFYSRDVDDEEGAWDEEEGNHTNSLFSMFWR